MRCDWSDAAGTIFVFSNNSARAVEIYFTPGKDGKDILQVLVFNTSGEALDYLVEDSSFLCHWMKYHGMGLELGAWRFDSYPGDFPERVAGILEVLDPVFANLEIQAILTGKAWEDVPFDWGEMR